MTDLVCALCGRVFDNRRQARTPYTNDDERHITGLICLAAYACRQRQYGHKNPAAVALGRLGGRKGGPARAAKLTAAQRRESARVAARARWAKSPST